MTAPPSGIILAGGQSRRLGQDKTLLRLWGEQGPTLLEATVAKLRSVCDEVLVVGLVPSARPGLPARLVPDRFPGTGALGAIYTGLQEAKYPFALAVACDMPFLDEALLCYMAGLPRDYDVLLPRIPSGQGSGEYHLEPLHAIYSRLCMGPILRSLERGQRKIIDFFPEVRVRYLEREELAPFEPLDRVFQNINTPEDLAKVMKRLNESAGAHKKASRL